jgi:hypothetical protein
MHNLTYNRGVWLLFLLLLLLLLPVVLLDGYLLLSPLGPRHRLSGFDVRFSAFRISASKSRERIPIR